MAEVKSAWRFEASNSRRPRSIRASTFALEYRPMLYSPSPAARVRASGTRTFSGSPDGDVQPITYRLDSPDTSLGTSTLNGSGRCVTRMPMRESIPATAWQAASVGCCALQSSSTANPSGTPASASSARPAAGSYRHGRVKRAS